MQIVSPALFRAFVYPLDLLPKPIPEATMQEEPLMMIAKVRFGSHLYGTATETSDEDWKGVFLPTLSEVILGRIPKTWHPGTRDDTRKNEAGEQDVEYYSLHHFLRLATQGQTVAIDMLFAPDNQVAKDPRYGYIWDALVANRHLLLSKQMNAFVGYARAQATKYSLKGNRLARLREFESVLKDTLAENELAIMCDAWESFPKDDYRENQQGIREMQIGGKWYGETTKVSNVLESVSNALKKYGKRANAAADADGVDWKALSHAVRVSKELIEILCFGTVTFPLIDAPLLLSIKRGELELERVQDMLDTDLAFIEAKVQLSHLPDKVDHKFWDDWLVQTMMDHIAVETIK